MSINYVAVDVFYLSLLLLIGVLIKIHVVVLVSHFLAGDLICKHLNQPIKLTVTFEVVTLDPDPLSSFRGVEDLPFACP